MQYIYPFVQDDLFKSMSLLEDMNKLHQSFLERMMKLQESRFINNFYAQEFLEFLDFLYLYIFKIINSNNFIVYICQVKDLFFCSLPPPITG